MNSIYEGSSKYQNISRISAVTFAGCFGTTRSLLFSQILVFINNFANKPADIAIGDIFWCLDYKHKEFVDL